MLLGTNKHRFGTQICDLLFPLEESYLADNYRDYRIKVQGSPTKPINQNYLGPEEYLLLLSWNSNNRQPYFEEPSQILVQDSSKSYKSKPKSQKLLKSEG